MAGEELSSGERYQKICQLGEGTFGVVSKARDLTKSEDEPNAIVAIKKIRMGSYKDGVNVTALREIKLLQEIKHPNVIVGFGYCCAARSARYVQAQPALFCYP